jgi:hypothetical protein
MDWNKIGKNSRVILETAEIRRKSLTLSPTLVRRWPGVAVRPFLRYPLSSPHFGGVILSRIT